jgi:hypothetical protein
LGLRAKPPRKNRLYEKLFVKLIFTQTPNERFFMLLFKLLLPLLAHMDPIQMIDDDADYGDEIVVLEDPSEIYEIEFDEDDDDDLENFSFEEDETLCH